MIEQLTLGDPVDREQPGHQVLEREIGRLGVLEDRVLQIGRKEREGDQPPAMLGVGDLRQTGRWRVSAANSGPKRFHQSRTVS